MILLGDALEAIHGSRRRFTTVRATGRAGDGLWRMWWQRPDCVRIEHDGEVTVRVGPYWWRWSPHDGASTNEGDEHYLVGTAPLEHLLDPRPLLASVLEVVGEGEVAGRRAMHLRVRPRRGRRDPLHGEWHFEGELDVAIDLEMGVALQAGDVALVEVAFGEAFPASVFAPPFPAGVEPGPLDERSPREVSLEEAAALAPFPVLLPTVLPEGARLLNCWLDPDDPPGWLGLSYVVDPGARNAIHIHEGPSVVAQSDRVDSWEEAVVDGVETRIQERRGEGFHAVELFLHKEGIPVMVHSDLARDAVVAVALSLRPA